MNFLDKAKQAAQQAVDKAGPKIGQAVDKAADQVDKRTGGKHSDKIATARSKTKDALDKLDRKNDDIPDERPGGRTRSEGGAPIDQTPPPLSRPAHQPDTCPLRLPPGSRRQTSMARNSQCR